MSRNFTDPLWDHFEPLWKDLKETTEHQILVAGGHGLLLKQNWLLTTNETIAVIAHPNTWKSSSPRATKDLDLVVELDLIAQEDEQQAVVEILTKHDFEVGEHQRDKRWKFIKRLPNDRSIIVEFHAPIPDEDDSRFRVTGLVVKLKKSLGENGFHAHKNAEAVGCNFESFGFPLEDLHIIVPNPLTWSIMKLTAFWECWDRSQNDELKEEERNFQRSQAIKHANDVCRIVAMTTRDERIRVSNVRREIETSEPFKIASEIFREHFKDDAGVAIGLIEIEWAPEIRQAIQTMMKEWFE